MNYGMGYNTAYVNDTMVVGGGRPYYNQPMIVQPSPQVVIVEDPVCCWSDGGRRIGLSRLLLPVAALLLSALICINLYSRQSLLDHKSIFLHRLRQI